MIRVILENLLLFLAPTLIYIAYLMLTRPPADPQGGLKSSAVRAIDDAPLLWLFGAGALLVVVTLVAFGSTSGGRPGQHYEPPSLEDGKIKPGHID